MKRTRMILCMILALCLVLSLTACSKKPAVLGTWSTTVDLADDMKQEIQGSDAESFLEGFTLDSFPLVLNADFLEDGTYSITVDRASGETAFAGLQEALKAPLLSFYESLGWDVAAMGIDIDAAVEKVFNEEATAQFYDGLEVSGKYRLDGDTLYLSTSTDEDPGEDIHAAVQIADGKLTSTEITGLTESGSDLADCLPLTFEKAN